MHGRAREQRRVDLERRVLGGRADEGEQARFDMRQEGILLGLVEAVHFIDETTVRRPEVWAAPARSTASRMSFTPPSTAEIAMNWASKASANQACQGCLPRARRTPQDHRMQPARFEGRAHGLARSEQVLLAYDFVEGLGPQALGQRRLGCISVVRLRAFFPCRLPQSRMSSLPLPLVMHPRRRWPSACGPRPSTKS